MRLFYGFVGVAFALALVLTPLMAVSYSSGALPKANGSPVSLAGGGVGICTACHSSFDLNSGDGSVTIDAPATFMPGETVEFTVTVDNTTPPVGMPQQGFEVSVENADAVAHVGTLVILDADNTQFAFGDSAYVTHTFEGNQQTSWTVGWTAPDDAPDTVTIYAAGNAGNGADGPAGDYIYTSSVSMTKVIVSNEDEAAPLAARLDAVYPNPFASAVTAAYTLDRPMPVTVTLYDGLGRTVRVLDEGMQGAGPHEIRVAADGLRAGVYFVEVRTEDGTDLRPVTLVR